MASQVISAPLSRFTSPGEPARGQAEQVLQGLLAVAALVLDVVDSEDGLDPTDLRPAYALVLQVDGHQGGLPVVAVDDLRHKGQSGEQGDDGAGEEAEALPVVVVAVQGLPLEIVLIVHKVPDHAVLVQAEQAAVDPPPAQGDLDVAHEGHLFLPALRHLLVQRQDDRHLVSGLDQRLGQAAGHIGQSPGLTEGNGLGRGEQDFHRKTSFTIYSIP